MSDDYENDFEEEILSEKGQDHQDDKKELPKNTV